MKYYWIYSLNSTRDVLNYLASCVNKDNSTCITLHLEFPLALKIMFILAVNNSWFHKCFKEFNIFQNSQRNNHISYLYR